MPKRTPSDLDAPVPLDEPQQDSNPSPGENLAAEPTAPGAPDATDTHLDDFRTAPPTTTNAGEDSDFVDPEWADAVPGRKQLAVALDEIQRDEAQQLDDALLSARALLGDARAVRLVVLWALRVCVEDRGVPGMPDAWGELDGDERPIVSFSGLETGDA